MLTSYQSIGFRFSFCSLLLIVSAEIQILHTHFNIQSISNTASSSVSPAFSASLNTGSISGAFAIASFKWLNAWSAFLYFPLGLPKHVLLSDNEDKHIFHPRMIIFTYI